MSSLETDQNLIKLIEKYGIRYVIRNYKLTDNIILKITQNEFSTIDEEENIDKEEIIFYQKFIS
jgi:hypothetical protein